MPFKQNMHNYLPHLVNYVVEFLFNDDIYAV